MFEEVKKTTKEELFNMLNGTIIKIDSKNNKNRIFVKIDNVFIGEERIILDEDDVNEDLTLNYLGTRILEIQEPSYQTVYKREKKKMTLEEIEEELGYFIELIEE